MLGGTGDGSGSSGAGVPDGGCETGTLDGSLCVSRVLNCGSSQFSTRILGVEISGAARFRRFSSSRCLGLFRDELGALRISCLRETGPQYVSHPIICRFWNAHR
jgi:hypothetical protein